MAWVPARGVIRRLSTAMHVPEHLKQFSNLLHLSMSKGRCMIVGRPLFKYPIAVVPPPEPVRPLLSAIRECESRPFRIISYEQESGKVFNCSFFNDEAHMHSWLSWLEEHALTPGSKYHVCLADATASGAADMLPTPSTLLFGRGTEVLTDTRFGEYQVGMAINFSRQLPLGTAQLDDMRAVAASAEFEERIARCMHEHNVSYFGRLAMLETSESSAASAGEVPALITALRYGSIDDARRGTAVVRDLMRPELTRWFANEHESLMGTTTQVLEL